MQMVLAGESPVYRAAKMEDSPHLVQMNINLAKETEGVDLRPDVVREGVRNGLADRSKARYFVVEVGGEVVGQLMLTYEWSDWRNAQVWWIQSVYINASHRRRGLFKGLYDLVKKESINEGACGLRLYVETSNAAAIRTYEKIGMTSHYHMYEDLYCSSA